MRTAAATLLEGYRAAHENDLRHTHRARPASITPPSAFVDSITDDIEYTPAGAQHTMNVLIRIVRGTYNSGDVADVNDVLVDGFVDYVVTNRHAAGANTLSLISSVEDDDGWIPEWIPVPAGDEPRAYYSTVVTLSGEGLFGGVV